MELELTWTTLFRRLPALCPAVPFEELGYRLTGRWTHVSGSEFVNWALLAGTRTGPDTAATAFPRSARTDFAVERTWDAGGMRAAGSHVVVLDEVFVPEK